MKAQLLLGLSGFYRSRNFRKWNYKREKAGISGQIAGISEIL